MNRMHIAGMGLMLSMAFAGAGCTSKEDAAEKYLTNGKVLFEQQKYSKARVEFMNSLQIDPALSEAYYYLALIFEKNKNWSLMHSNLVKSEKLNKTDVAVKIKLAQLMLLTNDIEAVLTKADEIIALDSSNAQANLLKAAAYMRKKDLPVVASYIEKAKALGGEYDKIAAVEAEMYREKGDAVSALKLLDEALKTTKEPFLLQLLRIEMLTDMGAVGEIEKTYKQLMGENPTEIFYIDSLVRLLIDNQRLDEAEKQLNLFIQNNPSNTQSKLKLIDLIARKDPERAKAQLVDYIAGEPDNNTLKFALIGKQLNGSEKQTAVDALHVIAESDNKNDATKAKAIIAEQLLIDGDINQSFQQVNAILAMDSQNEYGLLVRARLYLAQEDFDSAIADLRVILRSNPEYEDALLLLAEAYTDNGSDQLADDAFRQVLDINPGSVFAVVPVVGRLLSNNELSRSEHLIQKALKKTPDHKGLLALMAQIRLSKQDWIGAEKVIQQLQSVGGNQAYSEYLSGRIFFGQQQYAIALERFKQAVAFDATFIRAINGVIACQIKLDQTTELIDFLDRLKRDDPTFMPLYYSIASVYMHLGDKKKALSSLEEGLELNSNWLQGYIGLAEYYKSEGNVDGVMVSYQRGLKVFDNNSQLKMLLATVHESVEQYEQAKALYESVLKDDPYHDLATNNLASLLTDKFESPENLQRALHISMRFQKTDQPSFLDTYAWTSLKTGDAKKARVLLAKVVELAPEQPVFHYHYAMALKGLNKIDESLVSLVKAQGLLDGSDKEMELARLIDQEMMSLQHEK